MVDVAFGRGLVSRDGMDLQKIGEDIKNPNSSQNAFRYPPVLTGHGAHTVQGGASNIRLEQDILSDIFRDKLGVKTAQKKDGPLLWSSLRGTLAYLDLSLLACTLEIYVKGGSPQHHESVYDAQLRISSVFVQCSYWCIKLEVLAGAPSATEELEGSTF
jgi:hypothetical protein